MATGVKVIVPLFVVIGFITRIRCESSSESRPPTFFCTDLSPQNSLDLEQIMGMWYGSEILTHHDSEEGVFYYQSCVVIHLADITSQMAKVGDIPHHYGKEYGEQLGNFDQTYRNSNTNRNQNMRFLRLIWDENGSNVEYTLRYNSSRPGFWISSGPQKGTMLEFQYIQFSGTVQVMKAVGNHLVLTFCNNTPGSHLFTVVLARRPNSLTYEDTQSVRNLLKHRGLSTSAIRKVCTSGAATLASISMLFLIVLKIASFNL